MGDRPGPVLFGAAILSGVVAFGALQMPISGWPCDSVGCLPEAAGQWWDDGLDLPVIQGTTLDDFFAGPTDTSGSGNPGADPGSAGSDPGGSAAPPSSGQGSGVDATPYLIPADSQGIYPGRWCRGSIDYTIDFTVTEAYGLDPQDELVLWRRAADAWQEASGQEYLLSYAGTRDLQPGTEDGELDSSALTDGEIAITYGFGPDARDTPAAADSYQNNSLRGEITGHGGITAVVGGGDDRSHVASAGYAVIDAADASNYLDDPQRRLALYVHEMGHALGLGHASGADSVMAPRVNDGSPFPSPGDSAALATLAGLPCRA